MRCTLCFLLPFASYNAGPYVWSQRSCWLRGRSCCWRAALSGGACLWRATVFLGNYPLVCVIPWLVPLEVLSTVITSWPRLCFCRDVHAMLSSCCLALVQRGGLPPGLCFCHEKVITKNSWLVWALELWCWSVLGFVLFFLQAAIIMLKRQCVWRKLAWGYQNAFLLSLSFKPTNLKDLKSKGYFKHPM